MANPPTVSAGALQGAVRATLSLGGALPFNWTFYDYKQQGGQWSPPTKLGAGSDETPYLIASLAALVGDRLVWSVAALNLDTSSLTVDVVARFEPQNGAPQVLSGTWTASPQSPYLFLTVGVVA